MRLISLPAVVAIGLVVTLVNQVVILVLKGSWLLNVWGLFLTLLMTLLGCLCQLKVAGWIRRNEQLAAAWEAEQVTREQEREVNLRRELQGQLEQTEKLSMAGTLAAGIAHEIRNPLTSLKGFLQLTKPLNAKYTDIMLTEVDRINDIVSELLELAKPTAAAMEPLRVRLLLDNIINLLNAQAILYSVELSAQYSPGTEHLEVLGEENKLKQVFINLIKNAIEAMVKEGTIRITLMQHDQMAFIQIEDEGMGIPDEQMDKLGQPFFTTKERGTGLGLMVCQRIILDHHGKLEFQSKPSGGTIVTVEIPIFR